MREYYFLITMAFNRSHISAKQTNKQTTESENFVNIRN